MLASKVNLESVEITNNAQQGVWNARTDGLGSS